MRKQGNEFKVGIFVLICLAGLVYMTVKTGRFLGKAGGYNIYVEFEKIGGLEKKAPVMLNGREVGKVEEVLFEYNENATSIILKLWMQDDAKIRENPKITIKTLGLMGEKYIDIYSLSGGAFIKADSRIKGSPFKDMDDLMEDVNAISGQAKTFITELTTLTKNINTTFDENKSALEKTFKNMESISTHIEKASINFEEFTADIKGNPWKLLYRPPKGSKK